jgi:IS605 OrfB family transposase
MATLTYCKGLPTPEKELNILGKTDFEMFLAAYSPYVYRATCETVNHLLTVKKFHQSQWNSYLQQTYKINKRHANGIISDSIGKVDSGKKCRINHIKQLERKLKSAEEWLKNTQKKLADSQRFYAQKNWQHSKTSCKLTFYCSLKFRDTNWKHILFLIHHKKRYIYQTYQRLKHLKLSALQVCVPRDNILVVGCKSESFGNQSCQWHGDKLRFRVPYCLESQFGKYVETCLGNFDRKINRLPDDGAKTWHFYRKNGKWVAAVQFTPQNVKPLSRAFEYGCIGIDLNPSSIGWVYVDYQGNLQAKGVIPLVQGLPRNKQSAQIVNTCLQLVKLASKYACPIVCEQLDFQRKKAELREKGKNYARLLSSWAYARFYSLLESILTNRGIALIKKNPAYTSLIGLVKYSRMYGVKSDVAAAIVIARRAMNLSERLNRVMSAYLEVNSRKHVWHGWRKVNNFIKQCDVIQSRHSYYSVSNWDPLVKGYAELKNRASPKR